MLHDKGVPVQESVETINVTVVAVTVVSANLLHGSERFILQNKKSVTRHAAALKRAAQRKIAIGPCRARRSPGTEFDCG